MGQEYLILCSKEPVIIRYRKPNKRRCPKCYETKSEEKNFYVADSWV
jgi:hypothetical protein